MRRAPGPHDMPEKNGFPLKARLPEKGGAKQSSRFDCPEYVKALFTAGERAANTGICLLDAQTRFEWVNSALANETRATVDQHIGKTSREIVGNLATQIEPIYESVLRTGKPGVRLAGGSRAGHDRGGPLVRLLLSYSRQLAASAATGPFCRECHGGKRVGCDIQCTGGKLAVCSGLLRAIAARA